MSTSKSRRRALTTIDPVRLAPIPFSYYGRPMIPVSLGAWLVVLAFPFIVVAALAWPAYVIRRYRAIRRGATPEEASARFKRQIVVGGAICYIALVIAVLAPTVSPALTGFVEKGGLAAVVPLIFVDVLLAAVFSEARALRAFSRAGRGPELAQARTSGDSAR
jgi:hypothetical protein